MPDFDVDAWLDSYQPRTEDVRIAVDAGLLKEHRQLEADLRAALLAGAQQQAAELGRRIVKLEEGIQASGTVLRFQALTYELWADLAAAHPPTEEQLAKNRRLDHNPDTFNVAVISACSVEPKLTEDQVRRARETLSNTDFDSLWQSVYLLNREVLVDPKSQLAGAVLQASNGSRGTPAGSGSRARSSSAASAARSRRTTTPKAR